MTDRPWTLLRQSRTAELWRQDLTNPSGEPITQYRGSTFIVLEEGERRKTPEDPAFGDLAAAGAWYVDHASEH